ncbi:helix-turn-helix transcriptional regulator [uncultured Sphingomonas sp.]|uniref:helix-turn-helix domain-containing protein n=1 Tax=uncultured Sphingomonas sp. TaxID=158754 RepID=UPI0025880473|nr:helix-turn-helix transcriptional regulator [uncultured Sphingomonas sp.]
MRRHYHDASCKSCHFEWVGAVSGGAADRLTPRQTACLRLVWERQATSKEIGEALGISYRTVEGHLKDAAEALGAANRREAALLAFGPARIGPGAYATRVSDTPDAQAPVAASMKAARPWRQQGRRNTMTLAQTLMWIVAIGIGSLCLLSLAVSVGNGLRPIATPLLHAFDRLTH